MYKDRWIIMGRDECNEEFRVTSTEHPSPDAANEELAKVREDFPEARSMWVELFKDKAYYVNEMEMDEDWEYN